MTDRKEKNRHHFATIVSLIIALACGITICLYLPAQRNVIAMAVPCFLLVLVGRTIVIEKGIRRESLRSKTLQNT